MAMTLRLPDDLDATLNAYCVATGSSMAAVVRLALQGFFADQFYLDSDLAGRVASIIKATA